MRSRIYSGVVFLVVLAVACGGGSSSKKKKSPPPVVQSASVTIDDGGGPQSVSFLGVEHRWDDPSLPGNTIIVLDNSTPPGWEINLSWGSDVNPGSIDSSTVGPSGLVLLVKDPAGYLYGADETTIALAFLTVTTFATASGGKTDGTFSGEADDLVDPSFWLDLTGGIFTAARQ